MNHNNWIDRLDDNEINRLLMKKVKYKEISYFLDNKLINIIRDKEKIKLERKRYHLIRFSRYALSLCVLFFLLFFSYLYINRNILFFNNKCFITELNGNALIKDAYNQIKKINTVPYNVQKSHEIITQENSSLKFIIGDNSVIQMEQLSELKIVEIFKKKGIERTNLFVNSGNINFKAKFLNKNFLFEVDTDLIIIKITGTDFTVNVDKNKLIKVFVKEGKVQIIPKINIVELEKIKKIDFHFGEKIKNIILSGIELNKGESIEISYSNFKDIESQILEITDLMYNNLNKSKNSKEKIKKNIANSKESIDKIIDLKSKLFKIVKESEIQEAIKKLKKEKKFIIDKISGNININFSEKNTYITNDDDTIFISSDSNTAVYSINHATGKLKWTFKNLELKDITSPIIPFNDKLVLGTSNYIYILDKKGKILIKEKLDNGITYWAECIIAQNKIFIPTVRYLYFYDGEKIDIFNDYPKSLGQLYISYFNDKLFCMDSNELNIKIFDLIDNRIIWTSSKLNNRSFIKPEINNNIIYIADIKNNLYKFSYEKNMIPEVINIGTGILTNFIFNNKKIYFIGNDGFFYELNNNIKKKIIKVDNNPEINKYLTKKLVKYNNYILFCSDTGDIFYYDTSNDEKALLNIPQNSKKLPLIGTPVILNNNIYIIDIESNLYKMSLNL